MDYILCSFEKNSRICDTPVIFINTITAIWKIKVLDYAKEIIGSQMVTIFALAKLLESRDDNNGKHIERVQLY